MNSHLRLSLTLLEAAALAAVVAGGVAVATGGNTIVVAGTAAGTFVGKLLPHNMAELAMEFIAAAVAAIKTSEAPAEPVAVVAVVPPAAAPAAAAAVVEPVQVV